MSIRIVDLLNSVKPKSYLELGYWDGANHRAVQCDDKVSVDTNGAASFTGTTDEFFAQNERRFDVVFIDACHDVEFAVRDWNNAIQCCDRFVVFHDMVPPSRRHCKRTECSDSYYLLNHFMEQGIEFRTLDHDCGLTVVRKEHFRHVEQVEAIEYGEFMAKLPALCTIEQLIDYAK